ncbi:hypothetical protein E2C01_016289 [Portunus trituberculatus]|uniref:Uncharacterized protein n=1 Tax=Portunus trituberculatus TaxID=210409 RepID=A0A5B7DQ73_PORTR|nr:hypothetical protein [Portunus trituberculatus]
MPCSLGFHSGLLGGGEGACVRVCVRMWLVVAQPPPRSPPRPGPVHVSSHAQPVSESTTWKDTGDVMQTFHASQ